MLAEMQQRYVDECRKKKKLEAELKELSEQVATLSDTLAEQMAAEGQQNVTMTDGSKLHIRTDRYVTKRGGIPTPAICEILEELGLNYMVAPAYNASSLKSKIKEMQDQGEEIPELLAAALNIGETQRVIATGL